MELNLLLEEFRLNRLNLTKQYNIENVAMNVTANLKGADYNHLYGALDIADFNLYAPTEHYHLEGIRITAERQGENQSLYTINSDFLSGNIEGEASLLGVAQSFSNQIAHHLPILVSPTQAEPARFDYDLTLSDTPLLHYFTNVDFALSHPIHIYGAMDTRVQEMSFQLNAPQIEYNNTPYEHIVLKCNSTTDNMNVRAMASNRACASSFTGVMERMAMEGGRRLLSRAARLAGRFLSKSKCATIASACTPASVLPANVSATCSRRIVAKADSIVSCTVIPFGWLCEP